jgi:hypothetical protein
VGRFTFTLLSPPRVPHPSILRVRSLTFPTPFSLPLAPRLYFAVNYRSGSLRPATMSREQAKGTLVGQEHAPPADRIGPCRKCPGTSPAKGMSFRGRYLGVSTAHCAERKSFRLACPVSRPYVQVGSGHPHRSFYHSHEWAFFSSDRVNWRKGLSSAGINQMALRWVLTKPLQCTVRARWCPQKISE